MASLSASRPSQAQPARHRIGEMVVEFDILGSEGPMAAPEDVLVQTRAELLPELASTLDGTSLARAEASVEVLEIDLGDWPADPDWVAVRQRFREALLSGLQPYLKSSDDFGDEPASEAPLLSAPYRVPVKENEPLPQAGKPQDKETLPNRTAPPTAAIDPRAIGLDGQDETESSQASPAGNEEHPENVRQALALDTAMRAFAEEFRRRMRDRVPPQLLRDAMEAFRYLETALQRQGDSVAMVPVIQHLSDDVRSLIALPFHTEAARPTSDAELARELYEAISTIDAHGGALAPALTALVAGSATDQKMETALRTAMKLSARQLWRASGQTEPKDNTSKSLATPGQQRHQLAHRRPQKRTTSTRLSDDTPPQSAGGAMDEGLPVRSDESSGSPSDISKLENWQDLLADLLHDMGHPTQDIDQFLARLSEAWRSTDFQDLSAARHAAKPLTQAQVDQPRHHPVSSKEFEIGGDEIDPFASRAFGEGSNKDKTAAEGAAGERAAEIEADSPNAGARTGVPEGQDRSGSGNVVESESDAPSATRRTGRQDEKSPATPEQSLSEASDRRAAPAVFFSHRAADVQAQSDAALSRLAPALMDTVESLSDPQRKQWRQLFDLIWEALALSEPRMPTDPKAQSGRNPGTDGQAVKLAEGQSYRGQEKGDSSEHHQIAPPPEGEEPSVAGANQAAEKDRSETEPTAQRESGGPSPVFKSVSQRAKPNERLLRSDDDGPLGQSELTQSASTSSDDQDAASAEHPVRTDLESPAGPAEPPSFGEETDPLSGRATGVGPKDADPAEKSLSQSKAVEGSAKHAGVANRKDPSSSMGFLPHSKAPNEAGADKQRDNKPHDGKPVDGAADPPPATRNVSSVTAPASGTSDADRTSDMSGKAQDSPPNARDQQPVDSTAPASAKQTISSATLPRLRASDADRISDMSGKVQDSHPNARDQEPVDGVAPQGERFSVSGRSAFAETGLSTDDPRLQDPLYLAALSEMLILPPAPDDTFDVQLARVMQRLRLADNDLERLLRRASARLSYPDARRSPALRRQARAAVERLLDQRRGARDEKAAPVRADRSASANARHYLSQRAGLVLFAPYLALLFDRMGVLNDTRQIDPEALPRARRALQLLGQGDLPEDSPTDPLEKLLLGQPQHWRSDAAPADPPPDHALIDGLLGAVVERWGALGQTSPDGLREAFVRRTGSLRFADDAWRLVVDPGPFDMLLDRLPWSIGTLALPWMSHPLHVTWRGSDD